MPNNLLARILVVVEVILCFALPTYFLFWGVLTLPIWLMGTHTGFDFATIHALCAIGGLLGMWGLFRTLRVYLSKKPRTTNWPFTVALVAVGLASIWTEMTGQFARFTLDWGSALMIFAPTLCAIHVLVLAMLRSKRMVIDAPPDATLERMREGSDGN